MTEEEAKTKWCPFARVGSEVTGLGSINRDVRVGDKLSQAECIGSACMAWRIKERVEIRHKYTGQVVSPGAWRARGDYEEVTVPDGGFCGLAGAPR